MRAGTLRHKITLQLPVITDDKYSTQGTTTWIDWATVNAEIITEGGREFYAAQKINAETTAVIRIRYRVGISTKMRAKYGNRCFEILPPINDVDGKHAEILLSCKEVV